MQEFFLNPLYEHAIIMEQLFIFLGSVREYAFLKTKEEYITSLKH